MIRTLKRASYLLCYTLTTWIIFSYLEITIKCLDNPIYSKYNLFVLLFKNLDELLKGGIF